MNKMITKLSCKKGQTMVEYALILAGVAVALIAAVAALSGGISGVYTTITTAL